MLAILYTSGTTGKPKGATVTHRQAIANLQNIIVMGVAQAMRGNAAARGRRPGCRPRSLLVVPLFHVTGCLSTMTLTYATGAKLVLMPVGRFDPDIAMADDRTRAGHVDRRRADDHVAHPRVAEPREVRPLVGEARVVRRRAGRARARRAHRAGVPAHAQDADDRVRPHRDRVGRDRARRRRLLRASRFGRPGRADGRAARRRRRGSRRAGRGAGRDLDQGPHRDGARLLAPARRERGGVHRRLVPHRRHRLPRPRRLPVPRRPGQGHDHPRRRERVLRRDRERVVRSSRRRRRGGGRRAAQDARRRGQGRRAAAAGLDHDRRGAARVLPRAPRRTSRCRSTSSSATSRCRAIPRARC